MKRVTFPELCVEPNILIAYLENTTGKIVVDKEPGSFAFQIRPCSWLHASPIHI